MAFALTRLRAWGDKIQTATALRGTQVVELSITGANTDTDADIGDDTGTFWTDALADTTYGDVAAAAQTQLQAIVANALQLLAVNSEVLLGRYRVATGGSTTQYELTVENHRPDVVFYTGSAPTAWIVELVYRLDDGQFPVAASIGS